MQLYQAIIIALLFAWSKTRAPIQLMQILDHGVAIGLVLGIVMGDPITGLIVGATINMIYLGMLNVGTVVAADRITGSFFGVSLALAMKLPPEQAVVLAVPFGILGNFLTMLQQTLMVYFYGKTAGVLDKKGSSLNNIWVWAFTGGMTKFLISFVIMFVGVYFGQNALGPLVNNMPVWVTNGFSVVGGLLPAVGLGLGLAALVKQKDASLAFFVIAFFAAFLLKLSTVAICVFAGMLAWIMIVDDLNKARKEGKVFDFKVDQAVSEEKRRILSLKDVTKSCRHWLYFQVVLLNYQTFSAGAWITGMLPIMRKLYPGDEERQREELKKYDVYFQTTPTVNGIMQGAVIAMEEERALGKDVPAEAINAFRCGLMGPCAGIGDAIYQGVFQTLVLTIGIAIAVTGNVLGALFVMVAMFLWGIVMANVLGGWSYKFGSKLTDMIFSTGVIDYVMKGAAVVGCSAFGALAAQMVKIKIGFVFKMGEAALNFQDKLFDAIIPGLLPCLAVIFTFALIKKGVIGTRILVLIYLVAAFVLGAFKILA
jgi:PTS system mannose-specific IID component